MSTVPSIIVKNRAANLRAHVKFNKFDVSSESDEERDDDGEVGSDFRIVFEKISEDSANTVLETRIEGYMSFVEAHFLAFSKNQEITFDDAQTYTDQIVNAIADHALSYLPKGGREEWQVTEFHVIQADTTVLGFSYPADENEAKENLKKYGVENLHGFSLRYTPDEVTARLS